MSDRGEDGSQGFESHGNVQQVGSEEEVVIVAEDRHHHVPGQVQLQRTKQGTWQAKGISSRDTIN